MYINNNYPYYGYNTSAVPIIIGKIDSSNRVSLGENNYNIILPAYTSSRSADSLATTDGYLYVKNAGVLNKHEVDLARNEGASVHLTSTESHAADSTYRRRDIRYGLHVHYMVVIQAIIRPAIIR